MNHMTTFNAQHPRATTGTFTEKTGSAPDSALAPLHLPDAVQEFSTFTAVPNVLMGGCEAEPRTTTGGNPLHEANLASALLELLHPLQAMHEMHANRLVEAGWSRSNADTIANDVFDILRATAIRAIETADAASVQ